MSLIACTGRDSTFIGLARGRSSGGSGARRGPPPDQRRSDGVHYGSVLARSNKGVPPWRTMLQVHAGMDFTDTHLWRSSLGPELIEFQPERERLRNAFLGFRRGVAVLAAEIGAALPTFTVHDVTHIDALWGVADTIVGEDYEITPLEAFVLGGAFLLHDLGMGLAAWPERERALKTHPRWRETIASLFRRNHGRAPRLDELNEPTPEMSRQATLEMLRVLHAEHAERLPECQWRDDETRATHTLLEDEHLRFHLGPLIGRIAHSHWWDATRLTAEFPTIKAAPSGFPKGWTIDALKVACILRVADAAHLDDRRAPRLLRAAREIAGTARSHWIFQGHLGQVHREGDRLAFTATRPFSLDESEAWWLALETIQMVDRELHGVDAVLSEANRSRFAARSVRGSESPERFSSLVPVARWQPVSARVRVGDVAGLVERLGGRQLYGDDPTVPLRELIQNAADAVKARRALEGRAPQWGSISVRFVVDSDGTWLEVEDTGLGMSRAVMTGPLLDFGESYWTSPLCREEHPTLTTSGFEPIGRFGVGFFSVFMYGEKVIVTSRPFDAAVSETYSLEFRTGLGSRPVLYKDERNKLREGGTRVRVLLKVDPHSKEGMLNVGWRRERGTLSQLTTWLAPALEVDLYAVEDSQVIPVIRANDWETLDPLALLRRLNLEDQLSNGDRDDDELRALAQRVRPLMQDGRVVGRCAIMQNRILRAATDSGRPSAVTVGGLRADHTQTIAGILVAEPNRADRASATPIVPLHELSRWASEQASLLTVDPVTNEIDGVEVIHFLGGQTFDFPIARHETGLLNASQISAMFGGCEEIYASSSASFSHWYEPHRPRTLHANVLGVSGGWPGILNGGNWGRSYGGGSWPHDPKQSDDLHERSLLGLVIRTLASAWGVAPEAVVAASQFYSEKSKINREIGTVDGRPWHDNVHIIRRPPPTP